jgi:protein-tyrosine-phosphatase
MREMTTHKPRVLFLSTGNATRSLIAEGFLRTFTGDRFDVVSVGVEPSTSSPLASEVMKELEIDISRQMPKSVAQSLKERFGHVITICDTARNGVRYSPSHSAFCTGASSIQIPPLDCPTRKQKSSAACETRSRTRLNNS